MPIDPANTLIPAMLTTGNARVRKLEARDNERTVSSPLNAKAMATTMAVASVIRTSPTGNHKNGRIISHRNMTQAATSPALGVGKGLLVAMLHRFHERIIAICVWHQLPNRI
jgi:hypothetical protein